MTHTLPDKADQFFWPKVDKTGDCWLWTASRVGNHSAGSELYGWINRRHFGETYAHRASWVLHNGPVPDGMRVLHTCDRPPCVRPDHLFLGTPKENMQDMVRKGRVKKPLVLLEEIERWRSLREEGKSYQEIADMSEWSMTWVYRLLQR